MDIKQTGKLISELRCERKMTQKDLAEQLSVTDKAISRWETGRGLPDADSMIALSAFFDVTINELLLGKRNSVPEKAKEEEAKAAVESLKVTRTKKKLGVWIAVISAVLCLSLVLACFLAVALYKNVTGSPDCVITEDYSSVTIFGNKYLPFDIGENTCLHGTVLMSEAQVENADFFTKLFFGDKVYLVDGCDNADFIYLDSEYDGPSKYYCLESAIEKYKALLNAPKDIYAAEIITKNWNSYDMVIDTEIADVIASRSGADANLSVNCQFNRSKGEEAIVIYEKQSVGPFRRAVGELLYKNGRYYYGSRGTPGGLEAPAQR